MQPQQKEQSKVYSRQQYATKQFWDSRYKQNPGYFDWYAEFPELKQTFEKFYDLEKHHSILMLGCGNSKLSEQMYEAGYENILNMDISSTVIEQMAQTSKEKGQHKMKWEVMDATDMKQIQTQTIDVAIDKGTLDALIAGKNLPICQKMVKQTMRVLKKDGQFLLITHGSPEGRKKLFQNALGLDKYDYYVTRVDLSTMSTLINLMRSNLGQKPLNSIMVDKQAMQKSMLEFNLIKMLRKKRKNEKKFIVWSDYQKKNVVFNENQPQQELNKANQQHSQSTKQPLPKKTTYNPQKQCFCYVYSIQNKFAADLDQLIAQDTQNNFQQFCKNNDIAINNDSTIKFQGDSQLPSFGIHIKDTQKQSTKIKTQLIRSLLYLKKQSITNNPVTLYLNEEQYNLSKQQKVKFILASDKKNYSPIYAKTVVQVTMKLNDKNKLSALEDKLNQIIEQLISQMNLHPTPFHYAYLGIVFQRISANTFYHKMLNKYWYPTWQLAQYNSCSNQATYWISLPPIINTTNKNIDQGIEIIRKQLNQQKLLDLNMYVIQQGYIAYLEPRLFNLLSLCSSLYCQGSRYPLIVQEFEDCNNTDENKEYKNNGDQSTVVLKDGTIAKFLTRLFSAYS